MPEAVSQTSTRCGKSRAGNHPKSQKALTPTESPCRLKFKKSATKFENKKLIIDYFTDNLTAKASEILTIIELKHSRTRDYLTELITEDIIVAEGSNRNRTYKLKS